MKGCGERLDVGLVVSRVHKRFVDRLEAPQLESGDRVQGVEAIRILEPSYAIPMYYHTEESKLELDPLEKFIKEMGLDKVEPRPDLSITSTRSSNETNVVVLDVAKESE